MQSVANLMVQTARLFVLRLNKDHERLRLEDERKDANLDMAHELRMPCPNIYWGIEMYAAARYFYVASITARLFVPRPDNERLRVEEERNDAILDMAHVLRRLNRSITLFVETKKAFEERVSLLEKRFD
jgi:hypothetical protein